MSCSYVSQGFWYLPTGSFKPHQIVSDVCVQCGCVITWSVVSKILTIDSTYLTHEDMIWDVFHKFKVWSSFMMLVAVLHIITCYMEPCLKGTKYYTWLRDLMSPCCIAILSMDLLVDLPWNQVPNLHMHCRDFTTWQGTEIIVSTMAVKQHAY